ncbi:hypothetical protein DL96DRAFT_1592888 [Flagelloscypha sp. PMI_526]|nr:hypothetical protein DL96DRAFT_1592888 [Flagelloscypha sp. PMI_526]
MKMMSRQQPSALNIHVPNSALNTHAMASPQERKRKRRDNTSANGDNAGGRPKKQKKTDLAPSPPTAPSLPSSSSTDAMMNVLVAAAAQTQQLAAQPLTTTEDILRILQSVDMDKVADLLQSMAGDSSMPMPTMHSTTTAPSHPRTQPRPKKQSKSKAAVAISSSNTEPSIQPPPSFPNAEQSFLASQNLNPESDPAWRLANKWMSPSRLALLAVTEGLVYKKGKFSTIEEESLKQALNNYQTRKGLTHEQIQDKIFPKDESDRDNQFWIELTTSCPGRPIIAIYHHVRRARHPLKHQGKWTDQEDANLTSAVAELGQQWEKVSKLVGRAAMDCRDRYRNHIVDRDTRITGAWSKEEEDQLIKIVTAMKDNTDNWDWDTEVFWSKVAREMEGKRGRQQCRIKWTDSLSKKVKSQGGEVARWGPRDAYVLVHKVASLNVRHDTEIDWKMLADPTWNLWSPHILQRRWQTLKKGVRGHNELSHQDIVDILLTKKGLVADPPSKRRKTTSFAKRVTSAPMIEDEDEDEDEDMEQPVDPNLDPILRPGGSASGIKGKEKAFS